MPPGTDDARLAGKWGITNPRLFAVSQGLTEVAVQPQKEPDAAQTVPLNCVVNGNSRQGREDVFRFLAKKGQRVVVECFARRLDSQLDGVLVLTDDDGRQLASNGDYAGRDPLVEFVVTKDGDYRVALNDLTYRGGQPYRLVISDLPHVENVFPRAVRAGQPARLTVYGRNLGSGAKPSPFVVNDLPLDTITESVTVPEDVLTARTKDAPLQRLNMFGALPMRQSDTFRIEIEVNPTAYVYVIWVDPGHDVTPVYPWNPREGWGTRPATEEPIGRLSLPRDAANRYTAPDAKPGVATIVMFARSTPLGVPDETVRKWFEELPELPLPPGGETGVVWFDNYAEVREGDRPRTFGEVESGDPFARWQSSLRKVLVPHAAFQTAVSFARTGKK